MRDITCPADLDRLPACPSCQRKAALLAELAAFLGHLAADGELFKEDHIRAKDLLRRAEAEVGEG